MVSEEERWVILHSLIESRLPLQGIVFGKTSKSKFSGKHMGLGWQLSRWYSSIEWKFAEALAGWD